MNSLKTKKLGQNGFSVVEALLILVILAVVVAAGWLVWHRSHAANNSIAIASNSTPKTQTVASQPQKAEHWTRTGKMILANTTSTDTHRLSDGTYRMYYMHNGSIVYADSTDAITFSSPVPTGVSGGPGIMISNPSVIQIKAGDWIMVYEEDLGTNPQTSQRNLYLATSNDGMHFTPAGLAVDSSKQDGNFASVPNLVLLPNGSVRMYYVCGGQDICARISSNNGKIWTKEALKFSQTNVGDPDVLRSGSHWVMYFTNLNPNTNGLYKAVSSDGLNWTALPGRVVSKAGASGAGVMVDPDVVMTSTNHYSMFFGAAPDPASQLSLYSATYVGNIF